MTPKHVRRINLGTRIRLHKRFRAGVVIAGPAPPTQILYRTAVRRVRRNNTAPNPKSPTNIAVEGSGIAV